MRRKQIKVVVVAMLFAGIAVLRAQDNSGVVVSTTESETTVRSWISKEVLPDYPRSAKLHHEVGVAVAELYLDGRRQVSAVNVIDSPSSIIADAVRQALLRWKFTDPPAQSHVPAAKAKITLYFAQIGSGYRVFDPHDLPRDAHIDKQR